jgi:phenylacetate-CoA ligase
MILSRSIYTSLVSNLLFPLHEQIKGHDTAKRLAELERSQWWSAQQLADQQAAKLAKFVTNVSMTVPYYRGLFLENEIEPGTIKTVDDLKRIPLLDKEVIKANFNGLKSENASTLKEFNTGGSSGNPLTFLLGNERVSHDVASKWRATRWWDVDIGDKELVAWGSPIELQAQDKVKLLRDKLFRSQLFSAFELNETSIKYFIERLRKFKPRMLFGYPSVYHLIAQFAHDHGIDLRSIGIKVIFVTSERLYPYQRELIEAVFNAPVANGYGGRDAGFLAHECPSGKMHITAEDIIIEVIDSNDQVLPVGETGELVVTHLATSDFPFIRYRTGDIGAIDTMLCSCGRSLPVLKNLEGRSTDFVVSESGSLMHGLSLIYILREFSEISAFKIVQETRLLCVVYLIMKQTIQTEIKDMIIRKFKERLGGNVIVQINQVESIAPEKSGKYRYIISKVNAG